MHLRVNPSFCMYTICKEHGKRVAGFSSINMLSSPSAILEFCFSFDRKDFTDITDNPVVLVSFNVPFLPLVN